VSAVKKLLFMLAAVAAGVFVVANALAAGPTTKRAAIVHVEKGCHMWSFGPTTKASLTLSLKKGDRLVVVNHDLDMHKLVQVAGPPTSTGAFMMMHQQVSFVLAKVGLYRFHTRVADMRGMPQAKTIGPDNKLVLTVRVS
jgi:hypothetical protein